MHIERLVDMANRIGDFFVAMPDREEALSDTAQHLRRFWEPRMRRALLAHFDAHGGEGLKPFVLEAVRRNRDMLDPSRHAPVHDTVGGDAG